MKPDIHHHAEPAVLNPALHELVAAARAQPTPPAPADAFARLHSGYLAARQAQSRRRATYGGLALAAGLAALVVLRLDLGMSERTGPEGHVAQDSSRLNGSASADSVTAPQPLAPVLAPGVRVVAIAEETPTPTVLGPWEVGLAPGRYEVEVAEHPGPETLRARSAGGTVELHHGRVEIVIAGSATTATLRHGVATWVAPDGSRSELAPAELTAPSEPVTEPVTDPSSEPSEPDVRLLARRAEELLTSGKRDPAIKVLTQIVTQHPQEPAARSALLDLAPLLKASGRVDEARCAYQLYLGRYSGKAKLADEVQKALARLGDGPPCRGLKPR